jgi:hypothetical protein
MDLSEAAVKPVDVNFRRHLVLCFQDSRAGIIDDDVLFLLSSSGYASHTIDGEGSMLFVTASSNHLVSRQGNYCNEDDPTTNLREDDLAASKVSNTPCSLTNRQKGECDVHRHSALAGTLAGIPKKGLLQ